ncbi:MAG: THUMP domain-containing class I SAM-dependent RNA methyltransferase [Deltaproteobacteria bacterium]
MLIIAKTFEGLEPVLEQEINLLGGKNIEVGKRAISFEGDKKLMYKANLYLRTAIKVLVNINHFTAKNEDQLYQKAKEFNWFDYLSLSQSFSIETNVSSDIFTHSKYVAYKIKDAIADKFKEKKGRRPNVNTYNPDVKFNVRIFQDQVDISLDSSGESLHLRGYKVEGLQAPLSEVLAAGILLNTDFKEYKDFLDPMCGSGTLLTEALMINTNTAPNLYRESFGFMSWNDYEPTMWSTLKTQAKTLIQEPTIVFKAMDIERKAVFATKKNLSMLKYGDHVAVESGDFFKYSKTDKHSFLIMNPPYDLRIETDEIINFYKEIGHKLKKGFVPSTAWIFSANIEALKHLGLKHAARFKLMNAKLPAELRKYEIY